MKLLLDHCVPKPFARELVGHEVRTAYQMRWGNLKNGELLAQAAAAGFDAFITVDQNIQFQQNLAALPLLVIALVALDNDTDTLRPYAPFVLNVLRTHSGRTLSRIYVDGRVETIAAKP